MQLSSEIFRINASRDFAGGAKSVEMALCWQSHPVSLLRLSTFSVEHQKSLRIAPSTGRPIAESNTGLPLQMP